jgi:type I restriction enzyme M protein
MTVFPHTFLERAIADGHAVFEAAGTAQRIRYVSAGRAERFSDPEEAVRAEFWAELIYRYGYRPERIGVEVTVPDRTPRDAADLIVFRDDAKTRPFAVIECKAEGVSDTEFTQAVEQVAGNGTWSKFRAAYIGVVAGTTRQFLDFSDEYGVLEREANIIADLPQEYGAPREFKYRKGLQNYDIQAVSKEDLISAIRKCHQTLWGGGRLSPPAAFGELCKIVFVKISDEKAPRRRGEPYQFQIRTHESSRQLAERVRQLYEIQQEKDPDVFSEGIRVSDAQLRTIVSHLEHINLSETDLDTKGVAFEQFMDGFFKGDFGQYFTPREIIDFSVQILEPEQDKVVLDPACGSGGFLLHSLDFVRQQSDRYFDSGTVENYRYWHEFAERRLYGIEINDEIARVAKMNMILHDDGHTNVVGLDALEDLSVLREGHPRLQKSSFDYVLTNPPFGAQVAAAEHAYLSSYELGRQGRKPRRSQRTEILFIERVKDFLKPGTGKAAIVLPDGILTNDSLQYVRDFITTSFQVLAVVSLPPFAFSHFGAGVKASIIFVRRRAMSEEPDPTEVIFMAAPEQIGYDATGRSTDNELVDVVKAYRRFEQDPGAFAG